MKILNLFTVLLISGLFASTQLTYSQAWELAGSVPNPGMQPTVSTISGDIAWIAGGPPGTPEVFKTTNGGLNWVQLLTDGMTQELYCLWAINSNTAYVGEGNLPGNAKLYKTTNNGDNWSVILQTDPTKGYWNGIVFSKRNNGRGYGIALAERIYKTSDYGNNWLMQQSGVNGVSNAHNSLMVIDYDFYGFGMNNGASRIRLTTDGGNSWANQQVNLSGNYTSGICFAEDKLTGLAATSTSLPMISRTTDGGTTWNVVDIDSGLVGNCFIKWIPETPVVYVLGANGKIKKSIDRGLTWEKMSTAGVNNLYHFDFERYNNNVIYGYAVATDGQVIKLADSILIILITGQHGLANQLPSEYALGQNYPNPFNPVTIIEYSVPENNVNVKITVFDLLGREIETLVDEVKRAGNYKISFDGSKLASGMYFYRMEAGSDFSEVKKMILVK
jgi:photosystem II stability/assembly factor-like uncharacterized protein